MATQMRRNQALKEAKKLFGDEATVQRKRDALTGAMTCFVGIFHSGFIFSVRGQGKTWGEAVERAKFHARRRGA